MIILILIVTMTLSIVNYCYFKKFLNFINVFILMWCFVSVISSFGLYRMYVPPKTAYIYILIVMVMFNLSCLFFLKIRINIRSEKEIINLNWRKINTIAILCTMVLIPFASKGVGVVLSEGFYRLRLSGFTDLLYSTNQKLILMNIIQPLVLAVTVLALIELIENKKVRLALVVSVINCLQYILVFGGRWILFEFLLLAGIILNHSYGSNIIRLLKNNKLMIVVITAIVVTISLITNQRSVGGGEGFLYNVYVYFVGSIHLFGVYISNPLKYRLGTDYLIYGREFFAGILEPFYLIAKKLGMNWKSGIETINEVTQQFDFVSPETYMNNNATMIYAFLRDFGPFGLIICPIILGAVYSHMYKAKRRVPNAFRNSLYFYGLSIMPFLLFEWMPARMSIVLVPFFLYVLTRNFFQVGISMKR